MTFPTAGLDFGVIEMAMASGLGASLSALTHEQLFGEDQARYVVTCKPGDAVRLLTEATAAGVPMVKLGEVTTDPVLKLADGPIIPVAQLRTAHEAWFPAYMAGEL